MSFACGTYFLILGINSLQVNIVDRAFTNRSFIGHATK